MIIGILKSVKEVFPEIDLREFSALRTLSDDTYSITIEINEAKYVSSYEGLKFRIDTSTYNIKDEEIYSCVLLDDNYIPKNISIKLYGKWLKDVKEFDNIPFEEDFYRIFNELKNYMINVTIEEKSWK